MHMRTGDVAPQHFAPAFGETIPNMDAEAHSEGVFIAGDSPARCPASPISPIDYIE